MTKTRKILLALLLFGVTGTAIGAGTFASFSASTTNQGSTFATGTLVLSNQKTGGSVCLSTGGGTITTNSANCDILFTQTAKKPSSSVYTADVTLVADGSLNASALRLYRSGACATTDDGGSYHGGGDVCDAVQMTVQEYSDAFTTESACVYDADNSGTTCAFASSRTLKHFSDTYTAAGSALGLGAMNAGATRYFRISITFPDSGTVGAENAYQGRSAGFGLTWSLVQ